jgi:hypothetical protein
MRRIVVLPDGETWSELPGCKVLYVNNQEWKRLQNGEYPRHLFKDDDGMDLEMAVEIAKTFA